MAIIKNPDDPKLLEAEYYLANKKYAIGKY